MSSRSHQTQTSVLQTREFVQKTRGRGKRFRLPFGMIEPAVVTADVVVILTSSLVAGIIYHWLAFEALGEIATYLTIGILVSANVIALTMAQHNYLSGNLINAYRQVRYITLTWWFVCLLLLSTAFVLKISGDVSRGSTLSFFVLGWVGLVGMRVIIARRLYHALSTGAFAEKQVVVIAERGQQSGALKELRKCGYVPLKVFEISQPELEAIGTTKSIQRKLGDVISLCQQKSVSHIFLLFPWTRQSFIGELLQLLRVVAIPIHLLPDETSSQLLSSRAAEVGTIRTLELQRAPLTATEQVLKRAFDLIGASLLLILMAPLLLLTALFVKLDSPGPVLFRQRRNGFNGSTFMIFKFRTMRVLENGERVVQATRNDPRVTKFGALLRRTSIDELPQLLNVILGHMSLVGPRPHAVAHNVEYQAIVSNYAFRHHMKPGITGWAQVNGFRGETKNLEAMTKRVEFDLWYINHWSLWLDLRILFKTFLAAYRQPMAY